MVDQPSIKKKQQQQLQQLQYQGLKDITVQQSSFEWSNCKWLGQHKSYKREFSLKERQIQGQSQKSGCSV